MKPVIVLSVSAWGAVFIFLRSRSTSLSPVMCFVSSFLSAGRSRNSRAKRAGCSKRRSGRPSLAHFGLRIALSGGFLRVGYYVDPLRVRRGLGVVVVVPVPPLVRRGLGGTPRRAL